MSSFVPIGMASNKVVIDLASRKQLMAALRGSVELETERMKQRMAQETATAMKDWDAKRYRNQIANAVSKLREIEGDNAADEWLTKCMSAVEDGA